MIKKEHDFRNNKASKVLTKTQQEYIGKYNKDFDKFTFEYVECECGSKNDYTLSYRDKYALRSNNVICLDCGLVRINPRMDRKSLGLFYEEYYRPIYAGYEYATDEFFNEQYDRSLERIYSLSKNYLKGNEKVLEIGCGAGGILKAFQDKGFDVEGCDLGSKYLEYGRSKGLTMHHGSSQSLVELNKKFDFVIMSNVFEHMSNLKAELNTARELLNEGGRVFIDLPGILHIQSSHIRLFNVLQNAHNYNFSLNTLSKVLASKGFEVLSGDEIIRSIFVKTDNFIPYDIDKIHALEVLGYIEQSEKNITLRTYKKIIRTKIASFLQNNFISVYNFLKLLRDKNK
jgi:2-polyprenyl-3-methyl-5-hydroxy-6-metoxy-1,4-benzoquinol methylase